MNHCVPDFDVEDDFSLLTTSDLSRPRKSSMALDQVMELLWQNGQVVMQSQNQRSVRKSPPPKVDDAAIPPEQSVAREILEENRHFFVQEDEMASWLRYPLVDDSTLDPTFCTDLLYSTPPQCINHSINGNVPVRISPGIGLRSSVAVTAGVSQQPPVASIKKIESETKGHNVLHFARHAPMVDSGPSSKKSVVQDLTVVDSCGTLSVGLKSRESEMVRTGVAEPSKNDGVGRGTVISCSQAGTSAGVGLVGMGKEAMRCEVTVTSSPGDSCASADPSMSEKLVADDRKRKGREAVETEFPCEDVDFESGDMKKQVRGPTPNKRPRAAEVHNLSERRRRDRINEKMKALQELIPRCNKSDKASMLDEAIEYLKSLQLQVQMMSMGCGMLPMMVPSVQSYMPPMGMGMGMGMGMEMRLNRPMMPFPNMLAASVLPTPSGASHIGARFPIPSFHMNMAPRNDPLKPSDHGLNTFGTPTMNQLRVPNFLDAYPRFLGPHPVQMPQAQLQHQKQPVIQLSPSKPCSSRGQENLGKDLPGRKDPGKLTFTVEETNVQRDQLSCRRIWNLTANMVKEAAGSTLVEIVSGHF